MTGDASSAGVREYKPTYGCCRQSILRNTLAGSFSVSLVIGKRVDSVRRYIELSCQAE